MESRRELARIRKRATILRDLHGYGGLILVGVGLSFAVGWPVGLASVGVGLFYIGVFRSGA